MIDMADRFVAQSNNSKFLTPSGVSFSRYTPRLFRKAWSQYTADLASKAISGAALPILKSFATCKDASRFLFEDSLGRTVSDKACDKPQTDVTTFDGL